jgi:diacylglycerol O-acyltransferase
MASNLFDRRDTRRQPIGLPASAHVDDGTIALFRKLAVDGLRTLSFAPLKLFVDGIRRPVKTVENALSTLASAYRVARPIRHAGSPIMRNRTGIRRLAVTHVAMDKLRRAGSEGGGSLNDAFIAAIATGLSRYHGKRGVAVDDLVVCMPISVRNPTDPIGGNRATLMRFNVPAADMDAAQRIRLVHEQTTRARGEKALAHTELIAGALNAMPLDYISATLRHVDFVASDVPGFTEPLSFAGAAVIMPFAFSPTIGAALNVTLLSYVDVCAVGINVDCGSIPDLDVFYDCLMAGFDDVLALAV